MIRFYIICVGVLFFVISSIKINAKVKVFACEPEWHSLAIAIGGDRINAFSATSALQDPHYIRAKPSLIAKIRQADLLLCTGGDLEIGWLPILLRKASINLQPGRVGHLMVADLFHLIDKPLVVDRSMGDVHPRGNPHVFLNPYNILVVAEEINKRLQKIDAVHSENYQAAYVNFILKWRRTLKVLEAKAAKLKGIKVVVQHKSFSYLLRWLEIKEVATLEPLPSVPASVSHLDNVLQQLRSKPATFILHAPYDNFDASKWLTKKIKLKTIILPYTVGGNAQSTDLFALFENTINLMLQGL